MYQIPPGLLPVLDKWHELCAEWDRLEEERRKRAARRGFDLPEPETLIPIDDHFFEELAEMVQDAKAAILRRKEKY